MKTKTNIKKLIIKAGLLSLALIITFNGLYYSFIQAKTITINTKNKIIDYIVGAEAEFYLTIPKAKAGKSMKPIEEFYWKFENDIEFRNYITDLKVKRNNPGNLRFAGQPGAWEENGFATFKTPLLGFRALVLQVEAYQDRDITIRQFLEKYSPSHENDTEHLIAMMCQRLGVDENTNLKNINTVILAQDVTRQEHSVKYRQ